MTGTIKTNITILSGPYNTRDEGWDSFGEDDYPEVLNPKVLRNPKDGKFYVVKESKSPEQIEALLRTSDFPNRPGTAKAWSRTELQNRIKNVLTSIEDVARYEDMLANPGKYGIKLIK